MALDEVAARLHILAHQCGEHLVGGDGVFHLHLDQAADRRRCRCRSAPKALWCPRTGRANGRPTRKCCSSRANIEALRTKNSGKAASSSYVRAMDHPVDPLTGLPHDDRIRSRKLAKGVATVIVDATGLGPDEAKQVEEDIRSAALGLAGVSEARVAMTATQPHRRIDFQKSARSQGMGAGRCGGLPRPHDGRCPSVGKALQLPAQPR